MPPSFLISFMRETYKLFYKDFCFFAPGFDLVYIFLVHLKKIRLFVVLICKPKR